MSQIIIDAVTENGYYLNNEENIQTYMDMMCNIMKVKVLHRHFHKFEPVGISACYVLAESHFCVHTWPEKRQVSVDFYSCLGYTEEEMKQFIMFTRIMMRMEKIINVEKIKRTIDNHDSNSQPREL